MFSFLKKKKEIPINIRKIVSLEDLKEYNSFNDLLSDIEHNLINIEDSDSIPTGFKRISFKKNNKYTQIGDFDFYGNIIIGTTSPKTLSALCLKLIWELMSYGCNRYGIIIDIRDTLLEANTNIEAINGLKNIYQENI